MEPITNNDWQKDAAGQPDDKHIFGGSGRWTGKTPLKIHQIHKKIAFYSIRPRNRDLRSAPLLRPHSPLPAQIPLHKFRDPFLNWRVRIIAEETFGFGDIGIGEGNIAGLEGEVLNNRFFA